MSATHKRGDRSVARSSYELVRATLVDPTTTRTVEPFGAAMGPHLEAAALVLPDPFDWTGLDGAERAGTVLVHPRRGQPALLRGAEPAPRPGAAVRRPPKSWRPRRTGTSVVGRATPWTGCAGSPPSSATTDPPSTTSGPRPRGRLSNRAKTAGNASSNCG
jgi:hypothetical protein